MTDYTGGSKWRLLYRPHPLMFVCEVIACTLALVTIFLTGNELNPVSYAVYALSTYVLGIGIFLFVLWVKESPNWKIFRFWKENRHAVARIMIIVELGFGIAYASILTFSGLETDSAWMYAAAGYYLLISIICVILLRKHTGESDTNRMQNLKTGFHSGIVMMILSIAAITMTGIAIAGESTMEYPGVMIFAAALFTFIFFVTAIVNFIRFRGFDDPLYNSIKRFSAVRAVFSMFTLQLAMFASFGGEEPEMENWLNMITGVTVCVVIISISLYQLIFSWKEMHRQ